MVEDSQHGMRLTIFVSNSNDVHRPGNTMKTLAILTSLLVACSAAPRNCPLKIVNSEIVGDSLVIVSTEDFASHPLGELRTVDDILAVVAPVAMSVGVTVDPITRDTFEIAKAHLRSGWVIFIKPEPLGAYEILSGVVSEFKNDSLSRLVFVKQFEAIKMRRECIPQSKNGIRVIDIVAGVDGLTSSIYHGTNRIVFRSNFTLCCSENIEISPLLPLLRRPAI